MPVHTDQHTLRVSGQIRHSCLMWRAVSPCSTVKCTVYACTYCTCTHVHTVLVHMYTLYLYTCTYHICTHVLTTLYVRKCFLYITNTHFDKPHISLQPAQIATTTLHFSQTRLHQPYFTSASPDSNNHTSLQPAQIATTTLHFSQQQPHFTSVSPDCNNHTHTLT